VTAVADRASRGQGAVAEGEDGRRGGTEWADRARGVRVNAGCGASPTPGWLNFDNSTAVRVANWPLAMQILRQARILNEHSWEFVRVAKRENVRFANATMRIPCPDSSAEVAYSSHMIEHLHSGKGRPSCWSCEGSSGPAVSCAS
jgi:predicted SAM-dependent methyltransferase